MRFLLGLILVSVLAYFSPMILPWWGLAPLAAIVSFLLGSKWWQSLLYGLLGGFVVWGVVTFFIDQANESILSNQMAQLFNIDGGFLLIVITAALGGILAAMGAMTGSFLRMGIMPPKKKRISPNVSHRRRKKKWW